MFVWQLHKRARETDRVTIMFIFIRIAAPHAAALLNCAGGAHASAHYRPSPLSLSPKLRAQRSRKTKTQISAAQPRSSTISISFRGFSGTREHTHTNADKREVTQLIACACVCISLPLITALAYYFTWKHYNDHVCKTIGKGEFVW